MASDTQHNGAAMERSEDTPHRWYQFSLRTILWVMALVALLLGWWGDRAILVHRANTAEGRLRELTGFAGAFSASSNSIPAKIEPLDLPPAVFVEKLRSIEDWYEFADRTSWPFAHSQNADEAIPLLVELLKDPKAVVRYRAASTLGELGRAAGPGAVRTRRAVAIVPALIPLLDDENANVRWHAACALRDFGTDAVSAMPALRRQGQDDASPIATAATIFLREIQQEEYEARLIALLANKNKDNRERAIHELGRLDSPRGPAALQEAYEQESDPTLQDEITRILMLRQQRLAQNQSTTP